MSAPQIAPLRNNVVDVKKWTTTSLTRLPVVITVRGDTFTVLLDPHGQHTLSWRSKILGILPPGACNLYKYPLVMSRAARQIGTDTDNESQRRMGLARAVAKFASPSKPKVARASASMGHLESVNDSEPRSPSSPRSPPSPARGRVLFEQHATPSSRASPPSRAAPAPGGANPSPGSSASPSPNLARRSSSRGRAALRAAALRDQVSELRPALLARASERSLAFFEELGASRAECPTPLCCRLR